MTQRPIRPRGPKNRQPRTQFGALCWRKKKGELQILLVTGRTTGRWSIPKGWPVRGRTPAGSASREAYEEAGVKGKAKPLCLGVYTHLKGGDRHVGLPCVVAVFPLRVKEMRDRWPEAGQRRRKWFTPRKAASLVASTELKRIMLDFDPKALKRLPPRSKSLIQRGTRISVLQDA